MDTGTVLNIQGVFVAIGMIPQTEAVKDLVALDENGYIKAGEDGVTSVPGFFAAGDVRTKELRQIITAAADGCKCSELSNTIYHQKVKTIQSKIQDGEIERKQPYGK